MATAIRIHFDEGTIEQYEQLNAIMGHSPFGVADRDGLLFHWATASGGGITAYDVWESQQHFDTFVQTALGPALQQAGITAQPDLTTYEVHNWICGPELPSGEVTLPSEEAAPAS